MNNCTLSDNKVEVICQCTQKLKTKGSLLVTKKESKPEIDAGDQDSEDGRLKGKYKGMELQSIEIDLKGIKWVKVSFLIDSYPFEVFCVNSILKMFY